MNNSTNDPLAQFYKSLNGRGAMALEPDDPFYVPILEDDPSKDPILNLWRRISFAESESVSLLTGFRGNGKSTQLRRLKYLLQQEGCHVILVDMLDYVLMTKPIGLPDFVLSLMAALANQVEHESGLQSLTQSYWEKLGNFLASEVQVSGLDLQLKGAGASAKLGMKLKTEPSFKEQIQTHLQGHLSRLVEDARAYVKGLVKALAEQQNNPDLQVVLLVDSFEQIRGVGGDTQKIYESVVELFSGQASNLRFPGLHVVYTIPPFLPALAKNLGRSLGGHAIISWPNIHVRDMQGQDDSAGLEVMQHIIQQRFADWKNFISAIYLQRLAAKSGGDLRDFFRLIKECLLALSLARMQDETANLDDAMVQRVEEQLLIEMLPLAQDDARWLLTIHQSKEAALPDKTKLPDLARFLDHNLIMNYLNGHPWYDVHPLLLGELSRYNNSHTE